MFQTKQILQQILYVPSIKYCSQTIYQALLGSLRLYRHTNSLLWKNRTLHLLDVLVNIQQLDGGFDIGYEFNFGKIHLPGQSTAPELVGLVALSLGYKEFAREFDAALLAHAWYKGIFS